MLIKCNAIKEAKHLGCYRVLTAMADREAVTGLCAGERNGRKKRVRERRILPSTARPSAIGTTAVRLRAEGEEKRNEWLRVSGCGC
jgi:hypothetical protein